MTQEIKNKALLRMNAIITIATCNIVNIFEGIEVNDPVHSYQEFKVLTKKYFAYIVLAEHNTLKEEQNNIIESERLVHEYVYEMEEKYNITTTDEFKNAVFLILERTMEHYFIIRGDGNVLFNVYKDKLKQEKFKEKRP